ncbi:MAG: hypothetical protein PUP92_19975 [Rhizonema sp. PD38]|nr:hypothetical protein [Rhizonema sp. PD38]
MMKKIIPASILALAVATGFLFNNKPAQADGPNHGGYARGSNHGGYARGSNHGGYARGYNHGRYYAHGYYHGGYGGFGGFGGFYGGYSPFYYGGYGAYPLASCYPDVRQNSAYHPQAYADGYTQGQRSAVDGDKYERRTAGGEFARGFSDGYYGKEFAGQKIVVPDRYVSGGCGFY